MVPTLSKPSAAAATASAATTTPAPATERSTLLSIGTEEGDPPVVSWVQKIRRLPGALLVILSILSISAIFFVGSVLLKATLLHTKSVTIRRSDHYEFPNDFVWGAATSSYQIEGAVNEDGRGKSIWDTFCEQPGHVADNSSGAVACDHYHRFHSDVLLIKSLGLKAYRFSISWSRIYPDGSGVINQAGIHFYNKLIDTLLDHDIEPWVTLYHWDLPQTLEDRYNGWLSEEIVIDFGEYARTCFKNFGDRVKHWITLNESWSVAVQSYNDGTKAPGRGKDPRHETYVAGHHLILAHARAAWIYKKEFASTQKGVIGISNCGDFRYPKDPSSVADQNAAFRAMAFQFSWFMDPFFLGDYPLEMRAELGERLPAFSAEERKLLLGTVDFIGLNHYSSLYAAEPQQKPDFGGYWADIRVDFSSDIHWKKNFMGWSVVPDGCRELLLWISRRYGHKIPIVITENGTAEEESDIASALRDKERRDYFENYLRASAEAIEKGVNLIGYFAWSLMDNFEWEYGYTKRFGIVHVNYETQDRTPKLSGKWYSEAAKTNGRNIAKIDREI
jgi:beta-galactosidase